MGAVEYFLKIDGIEGESADAKHRGEIDVRAWNFGENREDESQTGGGTGGGKAKFQDFYFSAKVSKATPTLIAACANGQQIKSAVLTCRKVGEFQLEFLVYKFSEILITSFQTGALEESDILPVDHVSFSFEKIEVDYVEQKSDGTLALPVSVVVQV